MYACLCLSVGRAVVVVADGVAEEENAAGQFGEPDLEEQYCEPELEAPFHEQELPEDFVDGKSNSILWCIFNPVL